MGFREDKKARTDHYYKYVYGWKQRKCGACAGSGWYDSTDRKGRPIACDCCEGTGKETYKPTKEEKYILHFQEKIKFHERALRYWKSKLVEAQK
jgi:DnaJ-class molecular chaperone